MKGTPQCDMLSKKGVDSHAIYEARQRYFRLHDSDSHRQRFHPGAGAFPKSGRAKRRRNPVDSRWRVYCRYKRDGPYIPHYRPGEAVWDGKVWNTRKNHLAWKLYLRGTPKTQVPNYAAPARAKDFSGLSPAYTFVGDGEPFYVETLRYIENLKHAGISADVDVYHTDIHAFDMMQPELEISRIAAEKFNQVFAYAKEHYFAENL